MVSDGALIPWLRLLLQALEGRGDAACPLPAAILFLLLTGAEVVEVDEGVTVVMGRMNLYSWGPEWRKIGFDLLAAVRTATRRWGAPP